MTHDTIFDMTPTNLARYWNFQRSSSCCISFIEYFSRLLAPLECLSPLMRLLERVEAKNKLCERILRQRLQLQALATAW
jgi:hypothetical protein